MSDEADRIEQLMRMFYGDIHRLEGYVFSAIRDYHATQDILQETAIIVAKKAADYNPETQPLPWFMAIARNLIKRWYHTHSKERCATVSYDVLEKYVQDTTCFISESLSRREDALKHCIERIPEKQRSILRLRYEGGLECARIAQIVGRSVNGIYGVLKRLKESLRNCIEFKLKEQEII